MTNETATVESRIRVVLEREHCVDSIGVSDTLESAGLDSLDQAELWLNLEEEFHLSETSPDVQDECQTISQIIGYIERKTRQ